MVCRAFVSELGHALVVVGVVVAVVVVVVVLVLVAVVVVVGETHQKKTFLHQKKLSSKIKKKLFSQSKKTFLHQKKTFSTSLQASLGESGDFVPIKKNFQY